MRLIDPETGEAPKLESGNALIFVSKTLDGIEIPDGIVDGEEYVACEVIKAGKTHE